MALCNPKLHSSLLGAYKPPPWTALKNKLYPTEIENLRDASLTALVIAMFYNIYHRRQAFKGCWAHVQRVGSPREAGHTAPHARDNVGSACSVCREGDGFLALGVALQALRRVWQSILLLCIFILKILCMNQDILKRSLVIKK